MRGQRVIIRPTIPYLAVVILCTPCNARPEPPLECRRATDVVPAEAVSHHADALRIHLRPPLQIVNRDRDWRLIGGAARDAFLSQCPALPRTLQHEAGETVAQRRYPCDEVDLLRQRFEPAEQDHRWHLPRTPSGHGKEGVHGAPFEGNANLLDLPYSPAKR